MPCCAETGDSLVDARCDVEDIESFHPGGFWPAEVCAEGATFDAVRLVLGGLVGMRGDQRLSFRGELTLPDLGSEPFDPRVSGARIVLMGEQGSRIDASLAPGAFDGVRGWELRGNSFVHRDLDARPRGRVRKLVVQDRSAHTRGLLRVQLRARHIPLPVEIAEQPLRLSIAFAPASGEHCGDIALGGPPPALPCTLSRADGRLVCR